MTTLDSVVAHLKANAILRSRGNHYEDFEPGRGFTHHWGRTISDSDNTLFSTLTLNYNPQYTNVEAAKTNGYDGIPVNPLLVFNTVFGLSVEDLSEGGGPFLGVDELKFFKPVYAGDTLYSESVVVDKRLPSNKPGFGIATWHTKGTNQDGELVVEFKRSNLVRTRG
ncbi:acyl dehydratase [Paraburkholderia unamae]|uniref:MaoC family dehydratase n=1 Tax=Paraburkholderia unamae TaxID=219649 RepID=UPI000DC284FA|nr:MaoC family dehydratase [Paraburkholderia unamae]RAR54576.1 acyl dehydratase [Paraburkholderia unamae]